MRGRKPDLKVVAGPKNTSLQAPAWLPPAAKAEWAVAAADLSERGLLFKGARSLLANFCLCIAAIQQRQAVLDQEPGNAAAFAEQMKAINSAKLLASELGLAPTSRSRSFQGKSADDRAWDELEVG